ncbi:MAG: aldolase [Thaumarchaeota archaeon]|jgi:class I fructose-bisphosphate aldolase|nr:aldolase [Nitrososphaerota archaeon]NSL77472.1 aldolase [Nitrososphaerota archaeon]PBO81475.1 MAG: aldolase [Euryarchaeota archaeon]
MHPNIGKSSRIDTLFNSNDNAFVVAFDHGILMGPIDGIKDIESSVSKVVQGRPDAIQVTPPIAKVVSENFLGRNSPSLIARLDTSNLWRSSPEPNSGYYTDLFSVKDAVRLNAQAVVTYLLVGFENDHDEAYNLKILSKIAHEAHDYGMPLIIEPLGIAKGYQAVRDKDVISLAVRMATEVGADLLKVDYTGDKSSFREILDSTTCPVMIRGGPKTKTLADSLQMVSDSLEMGANGIVFGRNIWQSDDPTKITKVYSDFVHNNIDLDEALKQLE